MEIKITPEEMQEIVAMKTRIKEIRGIMRKSKCWCLNCMSIDIQGEYNTLSTKHNEFWDKIAEKYGFNKVDITDFKPDECIIFVK